MSQPRRPWSPEELEILMREYPDTPTADLARGFRRPLDSVYGKARSLGLTKSPEYQASPAACRLRRGGEIGKATRFRPGYRPWNAGTHFESGGRSAETRFKKGNKSHNRQPIGAERVTHDGYRQRKVTETGYPPRDWVGVHILLWREHHGPVPEGHIVVFKDRDKTHIDIDNLEVITRAENAKRNSIHRYPPEIKQAIRLVAKLKRKINERSESNEEQDD